MSGTPSDMMAASVYEAAARGVSALKKDGWVDVVAPGSEIEIWMREPAICHRITMQQILRC